MKILFVGDNRMVLNWGCRGTSIALKNILSEENEIIYTIYRDIITQNPLVFKNLIFPEKSFVYKIYMKIKIIKRMFKFFGVNLLLTENVKETFIKFNKIKNKNIIYNEIDNAINHCDAIVINGEGSFIFSTPYRVDTIFYLLILHIARTKNKKAFCLNMMISDCPKTKVNTFVKEQTFEELKYCDKIIVRDYLSLEYLKNEKFLHINYAFIPDALFLWNIYFDDTSFFLKKYSKYMISFPEKDIFWETFDFSKPYICISGSSLAAKTPIEARKRYTQLVFALKKLNIKLFIIPTCGGDSFLYNVSNDTSVPVIPVNINIIAGLSVLSNAAILVSGRWHPSIMASLGGVPCVFLGSNSHKTYSLQEVLEYDIKKEYNSLPSDKDIANIVKDVEFFLQKNSFFKKKIKNRVDKLIKETSKYKDLLNE